MAYAVVDDVLARAGRLAGVFSVAGKRPDNADLGKFLDDVSAEIDVAVRALGYDPAVIDAEAVAGFKDLAAYGALARGLAGVGATDPEVKAALEQAERVWTDALKAIAAKTFPAIAAIVAHEEGAGGTSGGSFWDENPGYEYLGDLFEERRVTPPGQLPAVRRDQVF